MLITLPPLKIQLRVRRPRKVANKTVGELEGSLTTSEPRSHRAVPRSRETPRSMSRRAS